MVMVGVDWVESRIVVSGLKVEDDAAAVHLFLLQRSRNWPTFIVINSIVSSIGIIVSPFLHLVITPFARHPP
jgi:hypothetical protein